MKTVGDLKTFIETFKTDIDADNNLRCDTIRKGLVMFLHSENRSTQFTATARHLTEIATNSGLIVHNSVDLDLVKSAINFTTRPYTGIWIEVFLIITAN